VNLEPIWNGATNRRTERVRLFIGTAFEDVERVVQDDSALLPPRSGADSLAQAGDIFGNDEDLGLSRQAKRHQAVRALTPEQLQAIAGYTLAGWGPRVIARKIGASYGAVYAVVGGRMAPKRRQEAA
jgi:hypothetical protein